MIIESRMSSILSWIDLVSSGLHALEFEKNAIFGFVNTLAPSLLRQFHSDLVKLFMAIESRMSLILSCMDLVRPELCAHVKCSLPLVSSGNLVNTNPKSLIGPVSTEIISPLF